MNVEHNGYQYEITFNGQRYMACCLRTGRLKTRFDRHVWYNANGAKVTDQTLIEALETGVRQYQSVHSASVKPLAAHRNGHSGHNTPHVASKGRVTGREPRTPKGGTE